MKKLVMIAGTAALAFGSAACHRETPAEKEVEKQADAIGDAYEANADETRALAEGAPNENAENIKADRIEAQGDAVEDKLKKEADQMGRDTRKRGDDGTAPSAPTP